jgi:transcriptional repressor NrdR
MQCPKCKAVNKDKVLDSRLTEGGAVIRRRRKCQECNRRFTTKERVENEVRLSVTKRDGSHRPYDREKIVDGVKRACHKLDISDDNVERLVDAVEEDIVRDHDREVASADIAEHVGRRLRELNAVAYVRFMSVYRKYRDVGAFIDEIREVKDFTRSQMPRQGSLFDE